MLDGKRDSGAVQARAREHLGGFSMFQEFVRQSQIEYGETVVMCCQKFVNCGAGTPHDGIFFDSNNQVVAPRQIAD